MAKRALEVGKQASTIPNPIPSDDEMDEALPASSNPRTSPTENLPASAYTSQGGLARGGTQAVAAYQRKLNSMGANITVDGAWGPKTQAAMDQFQSKGTTPKKSLSKPPSSSPDPLKWESPIKGMAPKDKPFTEVSPPKSITRFTDKGITHSDQEYQKEGKKTTEEVYDGMEGVYPTTTSPSGQVSRKDPQGVQYYPNGRVKYPDGQMGNYSKLPRKGKPTMQHVIDQEKATANTYFQKIRDQKAFELAEEAGIEKARLGGDVKEFERLVNAKVLRKKKG